MKTADSDWGRELEERLRSDGTDRFYRMHFYETVDSTNEECKRHYAEGVPEGFLAVAEQQTAGRGRSGRTWVSPGGEAAYFSFLLRPDFAPSHAPSLTLVMGLSVAQAVREVCGLPAGIKWPNDIVISHRKICGILTEALADGDRLDYVIIGTGINVNNASFDPGIAEVATSLRIENGGCPVSRAAVVASALAHFYENDRIYRRTADLSGLSNAYDDLLVSRGREVRIEDPRAPYTAVSLGIDKGGGLLVRRADGGIRCVTAGEVSVRGLYGYI